MSELSYWPVTKLATGEYDECDISECDAIGFYIRDSQGQACHLFDKPIREVSAGDLELLFPLAG